MSLIDTILKHKSLSIVGLEKNTGKTECLNYIIRKLEEKQKNFAVTSIGVDGEQIDQVTHTQKPEIKIPSDNYFITSEFHYHQRKIISEIINITKERTSLGRIVTAKSLSKGNVILSGPCNNTELLKQINLLAEKNIELFIIDGAMSRLTSASASISECMILNTGASVSTDLKSLVDKTHFTLSLIDLPVFETQYTEKLLSENKGVFVINQNEPPHKLEIPSVFLLNRYKNEIFKHGSTIFLSGALTNNFINFISSQKMGTDSTIIVKDFTKIFVTKDAYNIFLKKGGKIKVLLKTKIIAICVNPFSPNGTNFNSQILREHLSSKTSIPIYDILLLK